MDIKNILDQLNIDVDEYLMTISEEYLSKFGLMNHFSWVNQSQHDQSDVIDFRKRYPNLLTPHPLKWRIILAEQTTYYQYDILYNKSYGDPPYYTAFVAFSDDSEITDEIVNQYRNGDLHIPSNVNEKNIYGHFFTHEIIDTDYIVIQLRNDIIDKILK